MAQMLLLIRNHEVRSRQSSASVDAKEVILRHALADHHFDPNDPVDRQQGFTAPINCTSFE